MLTGGTCRGGCGATLSARTVRLIAIKTIATGGDAALLEQLMPRCSVCLRRELVRRVAVAS